MNEHQQQLQKQLWKLPEPLSLAFDPPRSFTLSLGNFFVYVDYHKRKGLKLCSTVFTFPGGVPDLEVRAFLKAWAKRKHEGVGNLEWGGHDEVLFIQVYPKNIIDDDNLSELNHAITSFRDSLRSLQQKMTMLHQKNRSTANASTFSEFGTVVESDGSLENASLEHASGRNARQEKRQPRLEPLSERIESRSADTTDDSEGFRDQSSSDQRRHMWPMRRNSQESKKEQTQNNSEDSEGFRDQSSSGQRRNIWPMRRNSQESKKEQTQNNLEDSEGFRDQSSSDQRRNIWPMRRNSQESTKEQTQNNSDDASADSSEQNAERTNFLGFGRRKKKERNFVPLDDDYFSDDGENCVESSTSLLRGL